MKTAKQYIKEIKENAGTIKAIDVFKELSEKAREGEEEMTRLMEVHKEVSSIVIETMHDPTVSIELELRRLEEKNRLERDLEMEENETGVFRLKRWPKLLKEGKIHNGDLIRLSVKRLVYGDTSYPAAMTTMTIQEASMTIISIWQDTFDVHAQSFEHMGMVYFENGMMYIERGDRTPLRIFDPNKVPWERRTKNWVTFEIVSTSI